MEGLATFCSERLLFLAEEVLWCKFSLLPEWADFI